MPVPVDLLGIFMEAQVTIGKFLKLCAAAVFLLALFGVSILNPQCP